MAEEDTSKLKSELPVIRTLKSDAAEYLEKSKTSLISAAARELERRKPALPEGPDYKKYFVLGGIFILIAALALSAFFYFRKERGEILESSQRPAALIKVEEEKEIELASAEREELLLKAREALFKPLEKYLFRSLIFSQGEGEGKHFLPGIQILEISGLKIPSRLKTNVENLTLGGWGGEDKVYPFLIFKVLSYHEAFAATLEWEKTMVQDLQIFFKDLEPMYDKNPLFKDRVIKNQDARVLEVGGQIVLAYAFFNRNILVLTTSGESLSEIISRFELFP